MKAVIQACVAALLLGVPLLAAGGPRQDTPAAKAWEAVPVPAKTPFDADAKKKQDFTASYRNGYVWAQGHHLTCPTNPDKDNLHAIRGWVEGWQAGVKAGGTGDLPAKYAAYLTWQEPDRNPAGPAPKRRIGALLKGEKEEDLPEDKYVAYWLTPRPAAAAENPRMVLLLSRMPIDQLARRVGDRGGLGVPTGHPLEHDAITVETHEKDSIMNDDLDPFKALGSIGKLRPGAREVTVNGLAYRYADCPLTDVVRLLEHPEGKIELFVRRYGPLDGAEQTARALRLLLKEQLAAEKAGK